MLSEEEIVGGWQWAVGRGEGIVGGGQWAVGRGQLAGEKGEREE